LRDLHPDLIVVAAYGEILPTQILELPTYGSLNVHASLLPRWRGAAPVQAAILAGDELSGVTIMKMDAGMDTGPILSQQSTMIGDDETGGELQSRLADLGAELLIDTIPDYISGRLEPVPQDDDLATYAPMLKKQNGRIDLSFSAEKLSRQVLAFEPWPKSFFFWGDLRIVIKAAHPQTTSSGTIGDIVKLNSSPAIITTTGALVLDRIQPAGKREMPGRDFLNGHPDFIGSNLRAQSSDQ
jgi:methionyl-tRNA formyltransferase